MVHIHPPSRSRVPRLPWRSVPFLSFSLFNTTTLNYALSHLYTWFSFILRNLLVSSGTLVFCFLPIGQHIFWRALVHPLSSCQNASWMQSIVECGPERRNRGILATLPG